MQRLRFLAARVLDAHTEPDAARHWHAFVAGQWRVVDHFDDGGRRYVIARRVVDAGVLHSSERELLERRARGESLKRIAGDLGLSVSAVSRRLSRSMKKLGIRSHSELPRLFSSSDA
jgi:DNA-binding NarL/FixJ family response regulator